MAEFELLESVSNEMVSDVYEVLNQCHDEAIDDGLTEAGADEAVRMAIEKMYHAMKEVDMNAKNSISCSKNFKKISTELVHESVSIDRDTDAIVYGKNAEDSISLFVVGNIESIICLIADMIILISKNSSFPISAILTSITSVIWNVRGTLR